MMFITEWACMSFPDGSHGLSEATDALSAAEPATFKQQRESAMRIAGDVAQVGDERGNRKAERQARKPDSESS